MDTNHFGAFDYVVVGATLLFSLLIGIYYAVRGNETNEELLVGGRKMSVLPVACSILVTYLSAITILGFPAEIYAHGIQIFMTTITVIIFVPLGTFLFVWVFYNMKLTSVYEYLELRFEHYAIRCLAAMIFILQVVLLTGVVLYAPSIALEAILGLPIWASVIGIGLCGTVYTSVGGLKAVVVTDVFQFIMILIGMLAMVIKGFMKAGGVIEALDIAEKHGRLDLFDLTVDFFMRHNTLNFLLGYGLNVMCLYGAYQPQVQRYCSLPTFKMAVKSILLSICLNIVTMSLVMATGVAIFATYAGCDPVLLGEIKKSDQIVPYYVMKELAFIPGMLGLFTSCLFSAVLSTLSSVLNSLAAVTWQDFVSRINYFKNMSGKGQANTSRFLAAFYGTITIFFAFLAQYMGPVLQATLTAVGATSGPLLGVFICGLFLPCVNIWGALSGLLTGVVLMLYITIMSFQLSEPYSLPLPTNVDRCPTGTNLTVAQAHVPPELGVFEWPEKIFTLSYVMYPVCGVVLTVTIALIISGLSGGFCSAHKVKKEYLHPMLHKWFGDEGLKCSARSFKNADRVTGIHDQFGGKEQYKYEAVPISNTQSSNNNKL